ncbi:MAG TPA: DUF6543 domain-containing protein [Dyella sp.]|uniref:dermonecrotic toxin domain-containing protein n=1 Tax=Dyella sp. TaxID=1869338 RepID=UPI002CBEAB97|nr:DUF6543 domain-containing protein [Dyella sp.]HTV85299.1 DUF6543 domain-containing protein [Dyella sp.]
MNAIPPTSRADDYRNVSADGDKTSSSSQAQPRSAGPDVFHQTSPFGGAPAVDKPKQSIPMHPLGQQAAAPDSITQRIHELGHTPASPTPEASLSHWIRQTFKQHGQDIDPDHTYLVSLNYNTGGKPDQGPYPGQVVRKESLLTAAAMNNTQEADVGKAGNTLVPYRPGGPDIQITANLPIKTPRGVGDLIDRYWVHGHDEQADYTYTHEGIYKDGDDARYSAATQLPIDPKDFRSMVWKNDPSKVVSTQLDTFWSEHEKTYAQQARVSFFAAASQFIPSAPVANAEPGDLKPQDKNLAAQWLKPSAVPEVERGLLSIHGYAATDVLYAHDKATGRILLYVPGEEHPLHGFDTADQLHGWLAGEMKDPAKRAAFAAHFSAYDRQDGTSNLFSRSGVESALAGIAAYPQAYAPKNLLWHKGVWDPGAEIALLPRNGDPFDSLAQQVKDRSYQDASTQVTSDKDVTERSVMKYLNIASTVMSAALMPLSMAGQGARVLSTLAMGTDLASGATNMGIGLDEETRSKARWADDVINGVMQSALAGAPKMLEKVQAKPNAPARVAQTLSPDRAHASVKSDDSTGGKHIPDGMTAVTLPDDSTTYLAYRNADPNRPRELYTLDPSGHLTGTGKHVRTGGKILGTKGGMDRNDQAPTGAGAPRPSPQPERSLDEDLDEIIAIYDQLTSQAQGTFDARTVDHPAPVTQQLHRPEVLHPQANHAQGNPAQTSSQAGSSSQTFGPRASATPSWGSRHPTWAASLTYQQALPGASGRPAAIHPARSSSAAPQRPQHPLQTVAGEATARAYPAPASWHVTSIGQLPLLEAAWRRGQMSYPGDERAIAGLHKFADFTSGQLPYRSPNGTFSAQPGKNTAYGAQVVESLLQQQGYRTEMTGNSSPRSAFMIKATDRRSGQSFYVHPRMTSINKIVIPTVNSNLNDAPHVVARMTFDRHDGSLARLYLIPFRPSKPSASHLTGHVHPINTPAAGAAALRQNPAPASWHVTSIGQLPILDAALRNTAMAHARELISTDILHMFARFTSGRLPHRSANGEFPQRARENTVYATEVVQLLLQQQGYRTEMTGTAGSMDPFMIKATHAQSGRSFYVYPRITRIDRITIPIGDLPSHRRAAHPSNSEVR